jgi:PAS domain S-box-containing protein
MLALGETEQQWQIATDAMPQLICLVNREGGVIRANRTLERWGLGRFGVSAGTSMHDVLHPSCGDPDCYLRLHWQRTAAARAGSGRAQCNAWDPLLQRHLEIRTQMPVREPGLNVAADEFFAIVTVDDVTEWRRSEDQPRTAAKAPHPRVDGEQILPLQAEEGKSHLLSQLDKAPTLAAMANRSGAVYFLNPAGRALIGLSEEEALSGLTLIGCQAPGVRARIAEEAVQAAERDGLWSGESVLSSRDGREIAIEMTLIAQRDKAGELQGFCLLGRDMSDWVRTEEALRWNQKEVWRLSAQHLSIQENERRRIAADLHDGLGQTLSLVKLSIEEAARSARACAADKAAAILDRLAPTVQSALAELRRMSMNLRPSALDELGILATLAWYLREIEAACPGIRLERDISVKESDVPEMLKISIFRIVQEATSNALKHAGAERLKVSLANERDSLELLIEDTGSGFDAAMLAGHRGFDRGLGMQSMKERAGLSGASFEIKSAPGEGTSICVRWPSLRPFACDRADVSRNSVPIRRQPATAICLMPDLSPAYTASLRTLGSQ